LATEKDLVGTKEKVDALSRDKERVLEREKQVKGRLEDALKTIARYEGEIENWKSRHSEAMSVHEREQQELAENQAAEIERLRSEHSAEHRAASDTHTQEKARWVEEHNQERERLEAEHARAVQHLRQTHHNEIEALDLRNESALTDLKQQQQAE